MSRRWVHFLLAGFFLFFVQSVYADCTLIINGQSQSVGGDSVVASINLNGDQAANTQGTIPVSIEFTTGNNNSGHYTITDTFGEQVTGSYVDGHGVAILNYQYSKTYAMSFSNDACPLISLESDDAFDNPTCTYSQLCPNGNDPQVCQGNWSAGLCVQSSSPQCSPCLDGSVDTSTLEGCLPNTLSLCGQAGGCSSDLQVCDLTGNGFECVLRDGQCGYSENENQAICDENHVGDVGSNGGCPDNETCTFHTNSGGVRQYFCSSAPEDPALAANNVDLGPNLDRFDFCKQIPAGPQHAHCQFCMLQGDKIYTAVGCVSTDQNLLAADLIRLMLGVGGGIGLLSILAAAFLFTTSQGDTSKVKQAKELMTAAVSGLLFIIFSIIILDFIGVRILKIPGLG